MSATLITIVVFSPVFALAGVEGRIFGPMGVTYLVVVVVSCTVIVVRFALTVGGYSKCLCVIVYVRRKEIKNKERERERKLV